VCGEDAVVDDVLDGWVGAQGGDGGVFVGVGGGVEDKDAEGRVGADNVLAGEAGAGLYAVGDDAVVVNDEITVGDGGGDGAGRLLGVQAQGGDQNERGEDEEGVDDELAQSPKQPDGAECGVAGDDVEWREDGRPSEDSGAGV
jgi:hypothetical protein